MPLRAFSPQRFYTLATGAPIEHSQAVITVDTDIPERGALIVAPDPEGDTELVWVHGVAGRAKERERFIEEIRVGEIPTPLPNADMSGCPQVRYHALESLHSRQHSVASFLGLAETLVDTAMRGRWMRCPDCAAPLPIFHSAEDICENLLTTMRGKELRIELRGPTEAISSWSSEMGFTPSPSTGERGSVRIDSLTCAPDALHKVAPLLASTRQLPLTFFAITCGNACEEFSWHGRCTRCDHTFPSFNPSLARELIERPRSTRATYEGTRVIDEGTLAELLTLPLERVLTKTVANDLFTDLQREIILKLSLTTISLNATTNELAPRTLAALVLLDLARDTDTAAELRLFTAPAPLFSSEEHATVGALIEQLSKDSPFVWITGEAAPLPSRPILRSKNGAEVAKITIQADPSVQITARRGEWCDVVVPTSLNVHRMATALYHHLSGTPQDLIASESLSPFTPYLIPLFPAESSDIRLVAHALGVVEPLAKMFAASHQAKMLGLTARDLLLGQLRQSPMVCGSCKGTGIILNNDWIAPCAEPCHTCWGSRFRSPAREITFKGRTLWEILNAPLSTSRDTLRALPKMKEVFEIASMLGIAELPLGMPVALLATHHRRLLAIAHAMVAGTTGRPSLIVVEEPGAGFSEKQHKGEEEAIAHPAFSERVSWIGVYGR